VIQRVFRTAERLARGDFEGPEHHLMSGFVVRSWPVPPLHLYYRRTADALELLRIYQ
jgi:hypothetical protein